MRRLLLSLLVLLLCFGLVSVLGIFPNCKLSRQGASTWSRVSKAWAAEEGQTKGAEEEVKGETGKAKEGEAKQEEAAGKAGEKKEGGAEEEPEGPVPVMYFVQWAVLVTAFGLGLRYAWIVRTRGKSHQEGMKLAYALTLLVLVYFALNYYPVGEELVLSKYHEPSLLSLFRFFLLLMTGVLVTFYGVLGRHEEI